MDDSERVVVNDDDSEEVRELKRRILSLEARLEIERGISRGLRGGDLLKSDPIDLYPGEQLDFVLSILEQVRPRCPQGSRPLEILNSLLSLNKPVGRGREILDEVVRIFRKGDNFGESDIAALRSLGFTYTPSRKHPKLRFMDKYMFVLASSPSDSRRGNMNKLSEISKCLAMSLKI